MKQVNYYEVNVTKENLEVIPIDLIKEIVWYRIKDVYKMKKSELIDEVCKIYEKLIFCENRCSPKSLEGMVDKLGITKVENSVGDYYTFSTYTLGK